MFGQKDDTQNQQPADNTAAQNPVLENSNPPAGFFNPAAPPSAPPTDNPVDNGSPQTPPPDEDTSAGAPMIMDDNPTDFTSPATPADEPADAPAADTSAPAPTNDQLLSMKQEALQQLTPLVSHLEQSPEEKFRTVMMMIQASDDHSKLNEAFDIAKQITDDKTRAQALLDVINEINYFTQQHSS